jgi:hypothetical protein
MPGGNWAIRGLAISFLQRHRTQGKGRMTTVSWSTLFSQSKIVRRHLTVKLSHLEHSLRPTGGVP